MLELGHHVVFFTGTLLLSVPRVDLLVDEPWLVRREDVFCRTSNSLGLEGRRYLTGESGYC